MTLAASIASDVTTVFLSTDEFAESVTYYPYQYFGEAARASRAISAVVFREQIAVIGEDGDTVAPLWSVHVHNNSTTGIASDEIDLGRDQIEFPPRDGKTAEKRTIVQMVTQDAGMLVLECR